MCIFNKQVAARTTTLPPGLKKPVKLPPMSQKATTARQGAPIRASQIEKSPEQVLRDFANTLEPLVSVLTGLNLDLATFKDGLHGSASELPGVLEGIKDGITEISINYIPEMKLVFPLLQKILNLQAHLLNPPPSLMKPASALQRALGDLDHKIKLNRGLATASS